MKKPWVVLAGGGKNLSSFALALSRFLGTFCVFAGGAGGEPFLEGKRLSFVLAPWVFARPFLFVAEDHAFTGGVVAGFRRVLSFVPYLLVLDAHLDLFDPRDSSSFIHRGNFLAYLLRRERFPEERIFVCSSLDAWLLIHRALRSVPSGLLYLSWDVDFGLPEVAHFSSGLSFERLEGLFRDLASLLVQGNVRLLGMDLVELSDRKVLHPVSLAFRMARFLLPLFGGGVLQ
ncbi:MAG: hypothetical protein ACUVTO_08050 [Candidatus Caldatribacteriaceae bacterium]